MALEGLKKLHPTTTQPMNYTPLANLRTTLPLKTLPEMTEPTKTTTPAFMGEEGTPQDITKKGLSWLQKERLSPKAIVQTIKEAPERYGIKDITTKEGREKASELALGFMPMGMVEKTGKVAKKPLLNLYSLFLQRIY